jgi:calcineurin-like phosphoesterase family protein
MLKINTQKGQDIWFTSDTHYMHKNMVRGVTSWRDAEGNIPMQQVRDFDTLEDMNISMITNINNNVKENDILFCLGDWSFGGRENIKIFRDQLICKNIYLILGNHDHHIERELELRKLFSGVYDKLHIQIDDKNYILNHEPIASWTGVRKGYIHLSGHLHSDMIGPGKYMDCGIDKHPEFRPYILSEIYEIMNKQTIDCLLFHHKK